MFRFSDKFKKILSWIFVISITVVFVFWGAVGLRLGGNQYIEVNGERVSSQESHIFSKVYPNADLVQLTVGRQELNKIGFRMSQNQVDDTMLNMPLFQVNGMFSEDSYREYMSRNMGEVLAIRKGAEFNNLLQQMIFAISQSQMVYPSTAEKYYKLMDQKRNISILTVNQDKFLNDVAVNDTEIANYYANNKNNYTESEKVRLDYIKLNYEDVVKQVKVSDEDVEQYYNQNIDQYIKTGRKKIAQIVINMQKENAKQTLDEITKGLKDKQDFAELAKKYSDDKLTAKNGGNAGWFQAGDMGDAPLDDAVAELDKLNDVSPVVTSNTRWYIFKLIELQPKEQLALNQVKLDVKTKVAEQRANTIFAEQKQQLELKSFEIADSLDIVAKELNVPVLKTGWITKQATADPALAAGNDASQVADKQLMTNPKVLELAFSDDVLENRNNSPVIDMTPESAVVLRIADYQPRRIKDLSEVKPQIKKIVSEVKAREKANEHAKTLWQEFISNSASIDKLATIGRNNKYVKFESNKDVSYLDAFWNNNKDYKQEIISAFELPKPDQKFPLQARLLSLQNGDQSILAVDKVTLGEYSTASSEQKQQTADQLKYFMIMRDNANFNNRISTNAKIKNYM